MNLNFPTLFCYRKFKTFLSFFTIFFFTAVDLSNHNFKDNFYEICTYLLGNSLILMKHDFPWSFLKRSQKELVLNLKVQLLNKIGGLDRGHLDINRLTNNLTFPYAILDSFHWYTIVYYVKVPTYLLRIPTLVLAYLVD